MNLKELKRLDAVCSIDIALLTFLSDVTSTRQVFVFDIHNPDVAVLTLQVFDEDLASSEFIGYSALPVSCIRTGIRTMGLCDRNGSREREFGFASLFIRVSIELITEKLLQRAPSSRGLPSAKPSLFNFKG